LLDVANGTFFGVSTFNADNDVTLTWDRSFILLDDNDYASIENRRSNQGLAKKKDIVRRNRLSFFCTGAFQRMIALRTFSFRFFQFKTRTKNSIFKQYG